MASAVGFVQMVPDSMKMWAIILVLGLCLPQWTQGMKIQRGSYSLTVNEIKEGNQVNRTLLNVECIKYSSKNPHTCTDSSTLDLSALGLNDITSNALNLLSEVETLDLRNNSLEKFSRQIFSKMTKLKSLELTGNKIHHCSFNLSTLNNLQYIDLRNNPMRILKNSQFLNLPKSSSIVMNLECIKIRNGSEEREYQNSYYEGPWYKHYSQLRRDSNGISLEIEDYYQVEPIRVKVCKTNDSMMESVSILKEKGPFVNCWRGKIDPEFRILYLHNRNITKFKRGWYNVFSDRIGKLDLSLNAISEITPELFNDLPISIISVDLSDNQLTIIKRNVIENMYLKRLKILTNLITIIEPGAFEKTNLEEINLKGNLLKSLGFTRTLPMTIRNLKLHSNEISEIPQDSFINLVALETLYLSNNRITHLPANIFRNCEELQFIYMRDNLLETIESGTFVQEKITEIYLADNKIRELKAGSFNNLRMLKSLELTGNKIRKISWNTFSGIRDSVIRDLILNKNEIEIIEEGSFANMAIEFLSLDHNKLSKRSIAKGAFQSCRVAQLTLDSNLFTSINRKSFHGLRIYDSISLQKNNIKSIKNGILPFIGCPSIIDFRLSAVQRIKNGAFHELRQCPNTDILFSNGVKVIEANAIGHN